MPANAIMPPDAVSDEQLSVMMGYNLKRVYCLIQAEIAPVLAEFNLRIVSFSALAIIADAPGMNQTQLAGALSIERSNLVQIIDELAGLGLIARQPVKGDRRRHALVPTPRGIDVLSTAKAAVIAQEQTFFGVLSLADQDALRRILAQLRNR